MDVRFWAVVSIVLRNVLPVAGTGLLEWGIFQVLGIYTVDFVVASFFICFELEKVKDATDYFIVFPLIGVFIAASVIVLQHVFEQHGFKAEFWMTYPRELAWALVFSLFGHALRLRNDTATGKMEKMDDMDVLLIYIFRALALGGLVLLLLLLEKVSLSVTCIILILLGTKIIADFLIDNIRKTAVQAG